MARPAENPFQDVDPSPGKVLKSTFSSQRAKEKAADREARSKERRAAHAAEREEREREQPTGRTEVEVDEPEQEEEEVEQEEREPAAARAERAPRAERRRERYSEAVERAKRAEAEAAQARLETTQAIARAEAAAYHARLMQQPQKDPLEEELERLDRESNAIANEWNQEAAAAAREKKLISPERMQEFYKRNKDLERKRFDVYAAQRERQRGNGAVSPEEVQRMADRAALTRDYPDIMSNQQAQTLAFAKYQAKMAELMVQNPGVPPRALESRELLDSIAEETRRALRMPSMRRTPAPTQTSRSRLAGVSAGATGGPSQEPVRRVPMGATEKKLAHAAYPKLRHAEAELKWAKRTGKRLVEGGYLR